MSAIDRQREYYTRTAKDYDRIHFDETSPLGLAVLMASLEMLNAQSMLDIGSGTGRVLEHVRSRRPGQLSIGVEPVAALREVGYERGIPRDSLVDGDATRLPYPDQAFDVVCAFAALHHIHAPSLAVAEMIRVARKAIVICDANNFAQGNAFARAVKRTFNSLGMWPLVDWIKTRGRGYSESSGDGIAYSYSVFNDYRLIRERCRNVHVLNLSGDGRHAYKGADSVVVLGLL